MSKVLHVVGIHPTSYDKQGYLETHAFSFMPNSGNPHLHGLVLQAALRKGIEVRYRMIDECSERDTRYLKSLDPRHNGGPTLLLLNGVQSHQFPHGLDLGALAASQGCMVVMGGPHVRTCQTDELEGKGVSFATGEAEVLINDILDDATRGVLRPLYTSAQDLAEELNQTPLPMPDARYLSGNLMDMLGIYPFRGCPYNCSYCSVTEVAGRKIRSEDISTTIANLRAATAAGIKSIFITSDNANKNPYIEELLRTIIKEGLNDKLKFFVQCDVQIADEPGLIKLMAEAGVFQIFLGVESLDLEALKDVHKTQNNPAKYQKIRDLCAKFGIMSHFSMITGFKKDTWASCMNQLDALKLLNPDMMSCYTMTFIPGTKDYVDNMGLITETDLSRFNTIDPTWRHPNMSPEELVDIRNRYYRDFYSWEHLKNYKPMGKMMNKVDMALYTLFVQHCVARKVHPMSGGIWRMRIDHRSRYDKLRFETFGITQPALPLKRQPKELDLDKLFPVKLQKRIKVRL